MGEARDGLVIGEITLAGVRKSVGHARGFVRAAVLGHLVPDDAGAADAGLHDTVLDDMIMVASETVANAITHTASGLEGGEVTVVLAAGDGVYRLEVVDDGSAGGLPHVKDEVGAETGRGMRIVDALATRWGFRAEGHRTVVWAEFPAPAVAGRGRARPPFSDRG
ncbi:ATP-binding protein [Actinomadura sp. 7K507]|uniref:ATP-binding protein n=1 Tax=Actinomadura sp. 7K507 TaxID=2530365 RepID=UPI00104386EC|nr:ATP-binding protein [Actinomadura sp. 7K507]TDC84395.1 ATP-binding protein [Actinomadura sp. 7K507]